MQYYHDGIRQFASTDVNVEAQSSFSNFDLLQSHLALQRIHTLGSNIFQHDPSIWTLCW